MRIFAFVFALIMFVPMQAQASYWKECAIHARVKLNLDTGIHRAEIKGGKVTDGHAKEGASCMKDCVGKAIKIKIKGNPPEDKTVRLKYRIYNGKGEDGVVNEESWEYWPPGIGDVLPW